MNQQKIILKNKNNKIEDKLKEAGSILESMRTASGEAGVSQNAIHYSEAQKSHFEQAQKWYKWGQNLLIGLIVSILITGISFVSFKEKEDIVLGYLEITVLIIISLWIYAINFCNKNFYAEKHNECVNPLNMDKDDERLRSVVETDFHLKGKICSLSLSIKK